MRVTVDIPDNLLRQLVPQGSDAGRYLVEQSVAVAYRDGRLTMEQVRQILGFATRMQVDAFLQQHEVFDYTADDLDQDMATMDQLLSSRSK
jgi:Uncharacterised protein family (UPF0175)